MMRKARMWSDRWAQLATMIDAGLPIDRALATLQDKSGKPDTALARVHANVSRGASLSDSLDRVSVLSPLEFSMLAASEKAGRLPAGLRFINDRHCKRHQRVKTLRIKLWMPQLVLVIGCLATIFVGTLAAGQAPADVVLRAMLVAATVIIATRLLLNILLLDPRYILSWLWSLPSVHNQSSLYQRTFEQLFFHSLIWQLDSGIDVTQALQRCRLLLSARSFRRRVDQAARQTSQGESAVTALVSQNLVLSNRMHQVLKIAEESGRWQQAIAHELKLQQRELNQQIDDWFAWIPRVYYLLVLVIIAGEFQHYLR